MKINRAARGKGVKCVVLMLAVSFVGCGPALETINGSIDDRNCNQNVDFIIQKGAGWTKIVLHMEGVHTGGHWYVGREVMPGGDRVDGVFLYTDGGGVSNVTANIEALSSFCVISNRIRLAGMGYNIEGLEKGLRYYQIEVP